MATGQAAAGMVVALMDRTATTVDPHTLVTTYAKAAARPDDTSTAVTDALGTQFGQATISILRDGTHTLAAIWTGAWTTGGGEKQFTVDNLGTADQTAVQQLYEDPAFAPSLDLNHIAPTLT